MGKHERTYHLVGWVLFLVCAAFFIASAVRSGDLLYLIGSIIFFVACISFVIPLVSNRRQPAALAQDGLWNAEDRGPRRSR
jgi:hypothetical protein